MSLPPVQTFVSAGRVQAWREAGQGPVILFLHGIGGASENWEHQFTDLSGAFRVIAWDMPGYGASDGFADPSPPADAYVDAAIGLMDHLGIDRAHIVGQSVAALIAARLCRTHPDRAHSFICSHGLSGLAGLGPEEAARLKAMRLGLFEELGPVRFAYEKGPAILAPSVDDHVREIAVETMSRINPAGFRQAVEMMASSDIFADLPAINQPALVIGGGHDPVAPQAACQAIANALSSAEFHMISDAGHYSAMESPAKFALVLTNFLSSIE